MHIEEEEVGGQSKEQILSQGFQREQGQLT